MNKNTKVFLVMQTDGDYNFWNQYDTVEDAVSENSKEHDGGPVEVYEAAPKLLGHFVIKVSKTSVKKVKV